MQTNSNSEYTQFEATKRSSRSKVVKCPLNVEKATKIAQNHLCAHSGH